MNVVGVGLATFFLGCAAFVGIAIADPALDWVPDAALDAALRRAGSNRPALEQALRDAPRSQRAGLAFLIRHMPDRDLRTLDGATLLEEVDLAYDAWESAPWRSAIGEDLFFNDVLPYAVVSEERTPWRRFLRARIAPLIAGARTPSEVAVRLNQGIYAAFGVRYSPERSRPDQNPAQVIAERKASCTGLSVLLIAGCRAAGVPARLVGTPLWADSSGNHSWVEIWDQGWHFTGAAEPTEDRLDDGWFVDAASRARVDLPIHAIYATSWAATGTHFPLAWDETIDDVHAVDVTARYVGAAPTPPGFARVRFVVRDASGRRIAVPVTVGARRGGEGGTSGPELAVLTGTTNDERADGNDHFALLLHEDLRYRVEFDGATGRIGRDFVAVDDALVTLRWEGSNSDHDGSAVGADAPGSGWGRPPARR